MSHSPRCWRRGMCTNLLTACSPCPEIRPLSGKHVNHKKTHTHCLDYVHVTLNPQIHAVHACGTWKSSAEFGWITLTIRSRVGSLMHFIFLYFYRQTNKIDFCLPVLSSSLYLVLAGIVAAIFHHQRVFYELLKHPELSAMISLSFSQNKQNKSWIHCLFIF